MLNIKIILIVKRRINDSGQYLEFIKKVQSISQIGLSFSSDPYALDNYKELKELSLEMLHSYTGIPKKERDLYKDYQYPTPQPAVENYGCKR